MSRSSAETPRARTHSVALLGIPYDAASSFLRGPAAAPAVIRAALLSDSTNGWSESGIDVRGGGALSDAGDVTFDHGGDVRAPIESAVQSILTSGARPLCLGGDHSVTYPVLRAVRRQYPKLSVLHLDAHSDLYDAYEGDRFSHACPFARIMEERLADQVIQVGIRTMNPHQQAQADRFGVEVITMDDLDGAPAISFDTPVYVSVDMDVLEVGRPADDRHALTVSSRCASLHSATLSTPHRRAPATPPGAAETPRWPNAAPVSGSPRRLACRSAGCRA